MSRYTLTTAADQDLFGIWRYLSRHAGVETAERIESELRAKFESLADDPEQGHTRSDLAAKSLYFFTLYGWAIVYRKDSPLLIVRVLRARRDVKRAPRGES